MSVSIRRMVTSISMLAVAGLIAVGCGSSGGDSGTKKLAAAQDLVVNIGDETEAGLFDPPKSSYLDTVNRNNALFANLYRYDAAGTALDPYLATDVPEVSDDGLTYTVKLRDDAKWSDGKPIVADDLVFGVQHALDPATASYFASFMLDIVGACEYNSGGKELDKKCSAHKGDGEFTDGKPASVGVVATDDHTVEFKLNRVVPWFDQLMTLQTFVPLRRDVVEKFGAKWTDVGNIVTSGPFKLDSYTPKSEIVVVKDDNFWGADDVKLDKITFRMIGEPKTAYQEFKRKRIDMAFTRTSITPADIDTIKTQDYYVSRPSIETQYMYMNTTNPALSDPKVRQALALAIDRPSLIENITKRGDKPMNTVVPSGLPGYDVFSEGSQDFIGADDAPDTQKAKDLLEEGGWDDSKTLNLVFSSDSGSAPQIAEQIQSDLGKIGVKVKLAPASGDVISSPGYGISPVKSSVDLLLQGWVQDYVDAQDWYQLFTCANVDNGLNASNFCDPEFDKTYDEALTTVDADKRYEVYKRLEAELTGPDGKMPVAPIYQPTNDTIVATYVKQGGKKYELTPAGLMYWDDISITADKK
ncbi:MAG: transporter substrate-binding protein [Thermoleophilia bacterium]|nr:transporter substrate-binding protein [Thermoleophilia bacterium]